MIAWTSVTKLIVDVILPRCYVTTVSASIWVSDAMVSTIAVTDLMKRTADHQTDRTTSALAAMEDKVETSLPAMEDKVEVAAIFNTVPVTRTNGLAAMVSASDRLANAMVALTVTTNLMNLDVQDLARRTFNLLQATPVFSLAGPMSLLVLRAEDAY
jgi:hypothetical protein